MSTSINQVVPRVATLPARRTGLVIRPLGDEGHYVVKDPARGVYFELGEEEHFLLTQLDGHRSADEVCLAFNHRFGGLLSEDDLDGFVHVALEQRLLEDAARPTHERSAVAATPHWAFRTPHSAQSILYWRKSLFDPDRLFTWLAPKLRFCWTRGFLIISATCIALAAMLLWTNSQGLAQSFSYALRWETALWVWLTLFTVTMLHESAHGLTCKHYGGEVHEIGFLLLFFMPCFYCNVSDAWLFREKSKRLWVTFAGGYFELFLWALAVFVWRLTLPGSWPHDLSFIVISACGVQTLFNFNPLIKLDGYYLLSDWLEIPNLQKRAAGYFKSQLRWLLWGAERPPFQPRRAALLSYGLLSWLYSLVFLGLMLLALGRLLIGQWGIVGLGAVGLLLIPSARGLFGGLAAGEIANMILRRHWRAACWLMGLMALAAAGFIEIEDRVGGPCLLRPTTRFELRAPVAGFVAEVSADEGDRLGPGQCVMRLHVPELDARIAEKETEVRESQARLRQLVTGSRPEELAEQRQRVGRAQDWRNLAAGDLQHAHQALAANLSRLDHSLAKSRAALEAARHRFQRTERLAPIGAVTRDEYEQIQLDLRVAESEGEELLAAKSALQAKGTRDSEAELARREKELADERGKLDLLQAGTRPEEIDQEKARQARLQEELSYLQSIQAKLLVASPVAGVITTPHLKEKIGQFAHEGELLCLVEEPGTMQAEMTLDEQRVERLMIGQRVRVKLRTVPLNTYSAHVERVAPAAAKNDPHVVHASVTVYCQLEELGTNLRPGMTGYARVYTGRRSIGIILADQAMQVLRTEFWW